MGGGLARGGAACISSSKACHERGPGRTPQKRGFPVATRSVRMSAKHPTVQRCSRWCRATPRRTWAALMPRKRLLPTNSPQKARRRRPRSLGSHPCSSGKLIPVGIGEEAPGPGGAGRKGGASALPQAGARGESRRGHLHSGAPTCPYPAGNSYGLECPFIAPPVESALGNA